MLLILDFSDPGDIVILIISGVLFLKRVAEMERYHTLRVALLTAILSCVVIYLLARSLMPRTGDCMISF